MISKQTNRVTNRTPEAMKLKDQTQTLNGQAIHTSPLLICLDLVKSGTTPYLPTNEVFSLPKKQRA